MSKIIDPPNAILYFIVQKNILCKIYNKFDLQPIFFK
jgi:hypothetical protein